MANTKQKQQKQLVVATESFAVATKNGIPRVITPATPLYDNDPIVKKYRDRFEPLADQVARRAPVVHTATAVPGEQRAAELPIGVELILDDNDLDEALAKADADHVNAIDIVGDDDE